jgi:hypothetical protein
MGPRSARSRPGGDRARARGGSGLIITEGTSPSPNGLGYPRIPGIFSAAQVAGSKLVADAEGSTHFIDVLARNTNTASVMIQNLDASEGAGP